MHNVKDTEINLVTPRQAARLLCLSRKTLENWRCKRRGPRYKKIGFLVLYDVNDLRAYIKSRTVETLDTIHNN